MSRLTIKWLEWSKRDSDVPISCEVTKITRYGFLWRKKRVERAVLKRNGLMTTWKFAITGRDATDKNGNLNGHYCSLDHYLDQVAAADSKYMRSQKEWVLIQTSELPQARLLSGDVRTC